MQTLVPTCRVSISLNNINFVSGKLSQCVYGHWDIVTCLAYSDDTQTGTNAIIASGSKDATVLVWIWDTRARLVNGAGGAGMRLC